VAGTIGGNGWNSDKGINGGLPYQWRGMAPEATIISDTCFPYCGYTSGTAYSDYPVHVSNHSYIPNSNIPNYSTHQFIDEEINGINGLTYKRPHIMAVGNQGLTPQYGQDLGYYSIYNPAKDAIGVGALNTDDASLSSFSSLGPTFDGRIKPDVVAGGCTNAAPRDLPYAGEVTVNVDYIRIYDPDASATNSSAGCFGVPPSHGAKPVKCWEFNTPGDFEGWLDDPTVSIDKTKANVTGGVLRFGVYPIRDTGGNHAYGSIKGLSFKTGPNQLIDIRYKIGPVPTPFFAFTNLLWSQTIVGYPFDGTNSIDEIITVDGNYHTASFPVGQLGRATIEKGTIPYTEGSWTGIISALRIDPVLLGKGIISTNMVNGGYVSDCGTSMAAPAVTGSTALLLQRFKDDYSLNLDDNPPLPSTIKAVLVQTSTDLVHAVADPRDPPSPDTDTAVLYYKGPDFATGYGLVNVLAADDLILGGSSLDCGTTGSPICESNLQSTVKREVYEFSLNSAYQELRVSLAWDDPAAHSAPSETSPKLVNDIDVVLIDPNREPHYPWRLVPPPTAACHAISSCADKDPIQPTDIKPATRGRDHLNNVEQVLVDHPIPGIWRVLVEGYNLQVIEELNSQGIIVSKPQTYSLATSAHMLNSPTDNAIKTLSPVQTRKIIRAKEDLNADGCIDNSDLNLLLSNLKSTPPYNGAYNLNGDNFTNIADARYLVTKFSRTGGRSCL
jgi:subtilisin family serine protease